MAACIYSMCKCVYVLASVCVCVCGQAQAGKAVGLRAQLDAGWPVSRFLRRLL